MENATSSAESSLSSLASAASPSRVRGAAAASSTSVRNSSHGRGDDDDSSVGRHHPQHQQPLPHDAVLSSSWPATPFASTTRQRATDTLGGGVQSSGSGTPPAGTATLTAADSLLAGASGGSAASANSGFSVASLRSAAMAAFVTPLRNVASAVATLWSLGDQIRQVYDDGTPLEDRRADRRESLRVALVFAAWCAFVAAKDMQWLRRVGLGSAPRAAVGAS